MLVSLAVVGLAAVLLSIGISRMGLGLGRSARADRQIDEISAAQFLLRHRMADTFPIKDRQTGNTIDFVGQRDSVDFVAAAPDNRGPDALQRYRLKLAHDGTLTLYHVSTLTSVLDPHEAGTDGWQATALTGGVSDLNLRYYGPQADTGVSSWQPDWSRRLTLPVLVRVRVDMTDASARAWPDLVIHLRSATGDTCERDLKTDLCKGST